MTKCVICGGERGFTKTYPEYPAHPACYKRVPIDYVLWFLKESQKGRKK